MVEYTEGYHSYYVYIITNKYRSTYYVGMTNNLGIRLQQHKENIEKGNKTFASKYNIEFLNHHFVNQYVIPPSSEWQNVRVFTNKIEFFNPGGLPKPIDELKDKDLSMPRNPILSKLFRMVKLAENAGFGFDKMESNWFKYNKSVPEYNLDFDSVTSSFFLFPMTKPNK